MSAQSVGKRAAKRSAMGGDVAKDVAPYLRVAAAWEGYVNVEFTGGEKEQFASFSDDVNLVQEVTAEVLLRGYKLSVVQVDNDDTVRATFTAGFSGMPDAGLAVSAWGESLFNAIAACAFIVAIHSRFDLTVWKQPEVKKSKRTF